MKSAAATATEAVRIPHTGPPGLSGYARSLGVRGPDGNPLPPPPFPPLCPPLGVKGGLDGPSGMKAPVHWL